MSEVPRLKDFHVSEKVGFLMEEPSTELPDYFSVWSSICRQLNELVASHRLRDVVNQMELLDHTKLQGYKQNRLAFMFLSFIGHSYIWQDGYTEAPKSVPRQLAIPWHSIARILGLPPVICQSCMLLSNYQKTDPTRFLEIENIRTVCQLPPDSSDWFFKVSWLVELRAAPGIKSIVTAMEGVVANDSERVRHSLDVMAMSITSMKQAMSRMHEKLNADIFYNDIRPFLTGWGGENSYIPDGILFEGVSTIPVQVIGGSAAQSSAVQSLDAALGLTHDSEREFLEKMKEYMPPAHAGFIRALERGPSIPNYVNLSDNELLKSSFRSCVKALHEFRTHHLQMVTKYIIIPARKSSEKLNTTKSEIGSAGERRTAEVIGTGGDRGTADVIGTGGTDLIPFLKRIRDSTKI